jgi:hypothetical protein
MRQIGGLEEGRKARDAGSPTSAAAITMAARAVQDIASADGPVERSKAAVRELGGQ